MSLARTRPWALLVGLSIGTAIQAASPEEVFEQGNTAYEQNDFRQAAEAYRALLRYKIEDPRLEYNLANAEFRLGNLGSAILHYERARRLDPVDPDIQANLEFARSFCFDRVEAAPQAAVVRWLHRAQNGLGPDRQAWVVLGLVWLIATLVAWCSSKPRGWSAGHGWTLTALLLAAVLGSASWYVTLGRLDGRALAVVLDDVVEVLAGPSENNATLFTVHEGLTLEIRSEREEWVQVSLPNGLNGWIDRRSLEPV